MIILDLGCGKFKFKSSNPEDKVIGLDKFPLKGVNVTQDITRPLPFASDFFDKVIAHHVLEHIYPHELFKVMNECWRVLKPDGLMSIKVPHSSSITAFGNIDHKRFFTKASFRHFNGSHSEDYYLEARFKDIEIKLNWSLVDRTAWLNPLMNSIVNLSFFEHYFTGLIPVDEIQVLMKAVK